MYFSLFRLISFHIFPCLLSAVVASNVVVLFYSPPSNSPPILFRWLPFILNLHPYYTTLTTPLHLTLLLSPFNLLMWIQTRAGCLPFLLLFLSFLPLVFFPSILFHFVPKYPNAPTPHTSLSLHYIVPGPSQNRRRHSSHA